MKRSRMEVNMVDGRVNWVKDGGERGKCPGINGRS